MKSDLGSNEEHKEAPVVTLLSTGKHNAIFKLQAGRGNGGRNKLPWDEHHPHATFNAPDQ